MTNQKNRPRFFQRSALCLQEIGHNILGEFYFFDYKFRFFANNSVVIVECPKK